MNEYNNKAVSGLPCGYASLVGYLGTNSPNQVVRPVVPGASVDIYGVPIPKGAGFAVDQNGNPMYNSAGNQILVSPNGEPIYFSATRPSQVCGSHHSIATAYSS
jgi:hypothetical protein